MGDFPTMNEIYAQCKPAITSDLDVLYEFLMIFIFSFIASYFLLSVRQSIALTLLIRTTETR